MKPVPIFKNLSISKFFFFNYAEFVYEKTHSFWLVFCIYIYIYIYIKYIYILALENCEHVLFVYIVKQNKNNSRIFTKNFVDFQNFKKFNEDRILMETNI